MIEDWLSRIYQTQTSKDLETLRVELLGKSGALTQELRSLGSLSPEEKRAKGQEVNEKKKILEEALRDRLETIVAQEKQQRLEKETLDITLPPLAHSLGSLHLLTIFQKEILDYFRGQGFTIEDGPEIEDEFHNFDALNIPGHHPARQSHDTFYVGQGERLLRTHTSNVEIRTLKRSKPPFRIISVGRVYRSDALDATHTPMFHQVEGMVIEPGIHMGHLKGCLTDFCHHIFGDKNIPIRFRPSFFPFTEPGMEMDICCRRTPQGLVFDPNGQWMEVLGCGMTHPNVFKSCDLDPNEHQGFAFGMGIERLLMLKYGIIDIRDLYTGDQKWVKHYGNVG